MERRYLSILSVLFILFLGLYFVIPKISSGINSGAFSNQNIKTVDAVKFKQLDDDMDLIIYDARPLEDYVKGHVKGSRNLKLSEIPKTPLSVEQYTSNTFVLLYGTTNEQAITVSESLKNLGITQVVVLDGGYESWVKAGYETEADFIVK